MTVATFVRDLMFRVRIEETARRLGQDILRLEVEADPIPLVEAGRPLGIVVDLDGIDDPGELIRRIRSSRAGATPIVAFLSHVDTSRWSAAEAAGADLVLPRSRFQSLLPDVLLSLAALATAPDSMMATAPRPETARAVTAAHRTAVWFRDGSRGVIDVVGADRIRVVHGQTTNDIRALSPGSGAFAWFLSPKGVVDHEAHVLVEEDRVRLLTSRARRQELLDRLTKFIIMEDARAVLPSPDITVLALVGPAADNVVADLLDLPLPPATPLSHATPPSTAGVLTVARFPDFGAAGILLLAPEPRAQEIEARLRTRPELIEADAESQDVLRIEAGLPRTGIDTDADTLTAELDQDERAVSFTKGCYTGQEIVARMKTYGRPKRLLRGLIVGGSTAPPRGSEILHLGTVVGTVTSSAISPTRARPIALALLPAERARPESRLVVRTGGTLVSATVAALPFVAP